MVGVSTGGILNVILDPILIFGLDMGTGGAALATGISQAVSFLILLAMFLSGKTIVRLGARYISRSLGDYRLIAATGLPTICRQSLGSLAAAVLNIQAIAYGGDAAGAAITIAGKVYILVRNVVIGFGQGFQPVAGYNYGAGNRRRNAYIAQISRFHREHPPLGGDYRRIAHMPGDLSGIKRSRHDQKPQIVA
jgi:Na+-driven multidrug efflux pump